MHPYLTEQLVHERIAGLRRSATSSAGSRASRRARPNRERVGWLLVTLGLRLVGGDGRRMPAHGVG